jgi:pimeloyl-ACP methyl ester carboxylesterase
MPRTPFSIAAISGWESGDGPALLFLHGGPGMSDYGDLVQPEAGGWRFISYQQRGLAPSTEDGPFTVEQHVADAIAVLDSRGVERAVVAGHSWGGHFALHLALAHPERVAGLLLIDGLGAVGDGGLADCGQALMARLLPEAAPRLSEIDDQMSESGPTDDLMTEHLRLVWPGYFADTRRAPPPPDGFRVSAAGYAGTMASVLALLEAGFAARLADIRMPVVSVLGEQSPIPVSQGEDTAALIAGADVRVIPAAGHLPWIEQPGCVAEGLARLASLTRVG